MFFDLVQTLPASGDPSFTLLSDWTEANPGTPRFDYDLNGAGYLGWVAGSAGNNSSRSFTNLEAEWGVVQ